VSRKQRPDTSDRAWIGRDFFQRDPVTCSRELVGCELVWGRCSGIVVETEAYAALNDEASHTWSRPSAREFISRHQAGAAYVYFNYGMYWLLNVLVKGGSEDGFVLLRALEPVRGIPLMTRRRLAHRRSPLAHPRMLCSGPGKLTVALGVDGKDHGRDLCRGKTVGFVGASIAQCVHADARIGISRAQHLEWRFTLRGSPYVSVKPRSH
jgi:DNA-3-methyladenine glycosylase